MKFHNAHISILLVYMSFYIPNAVAGDMQKLVVKESPDTFIAANAAIALVMAQPLLQRAYLEYRFRHLSQRLQTLNSFDAAHYAHLKSAHEKCLDVVTQRALPDDLITLMATSYLATMKTHNDQRKKIKEERDKVTAQLREVNETLDRIGAPIILGIPTFSFIAGVALGYKYFPNNRFFKYFCEVGDPIKK